MRLRAPRLIAISCLGVITLSGCESLYLHDDGLQKQTDSALSAYKAADIPTAIKTKITLQQQTDQAQLTAILNQENAMRELALAGLLDDGGDSNDSAVKRFDGAIKKRITALAGPDYKPPSASPIGRQEQLETLQAQLNRSQAMVQAMLAQYQAKGGTGLTGCPIDASYQPPAALSSLLAVIKATCDSIAYDKSSITIRSNSGNVAGLLKSVQDELDALNGVIATDKTNAATQAKTLKEAKDKLNAAIQSTQPIDQTVQGYLKNLDQALKAADQAAKTLGEPDDQPSTVLAAIKFRTTTLCDVLEASANTSCSGAPPGDPASAANKALGSLAAGFSDLFDAQAAADPSPAVLSIALAFQTGREAQAQTAVDTLQARLTLLQAEERALRGELDFLVSAETELMKGSGNLAAKSCQDKGLATIFSGKDCSGRATIARALIHYNLSWVKGRTPARLDSIAQSQTLYSHKLDIALAKATARDGVITITLQALDTYGQGGIPPQTIASFLQAMGIAAIAKGVN